MAELVQTLAGAALWLGALAAVTAATNRVAGRPPLEAHALLIAWPVFVFTEILGIKLLSVAHLLTTTGVVVLHAAIAVAALAALRRFPRGPGASAVPAEPDADAGLVRRIALITLAVTLGALALFALITPVHVWDVQAYHMPMVASYVQNESLAAWPAQDLRQVYRVNAAELHMLGLALLTRSDAWVEAVNVVALGVAFTAALSIARRVIGREILAWIAAVLVLTAPQILLGSVTAKNDIVFMALVLCVFHWTIDLIAEPARPLRRLVLLGGIAALAVATKVMGLNVLGAAGLVLLIVAMRRRVPWHAPVLLGAFAAIGLALLVGDVYWQNLTRSEAAVPVGTMPGEIHFTSGLDNVIAAARYYVYELSFRRLVTPQVIEHDFSHYGYFFPFLLALGTWAAARPLVTRRSAEPALAVLSLLVLVLFVSVIAIRQPIGWDQRFMIWLVPCFAVLALSLLRDVPARPLLVLASFAAAFAATNLFRTFTDASEGLFTRSAQHLAAEGELATLADVVQEKYRFKIDGYAALGAAAAARDSVLYVGAEDTWMYPAWGRRFTRYVRGVADAADAERQVASNVYRFIVVEDDASPDLRAVVTGAASRYGDLVVADGRRILVRDGGRHE